MPVRLPQMKDTKRGDTLTEVMFAFAIFALVSILSISMMNMGIANAEQSLELVTARNEINAQAEAIRFIHSSYVAERSLAESGDVKNQQYQKLWGKLIGEAKTNNDIDLFSFCQESYSKGEDYYRNQLSSMGAFIINERNIQKGNDVAYISASTGSSRDLFSLATLSARILFTDSGTNPENGEAMRIPSPADYTKVARIDGIWVNTVKVEVGGKTSAYDFYINACWYGPNAKAPTVLDTVIRLSNPENTTP